VSAGQEVRLERVLGRLVRDATGRPAGRIEDVEAEPDGDAYLVTYALLGPTRWVAQLLAVGYRLPTLRALGLGRKPRIRRVPWPWLDLSDPERPRLKPTVVGDD
jgi:sporulation protein YlmC with PRC-barrel domain